MDVFCIRPKLGEGGDSETVESGVSVIWDINEIDLLSRVEWELNKFNFFET